MPLDYDVVMAVHNGADMIRDALQSIAAQSQQPQQVIIVDDGSTDELRETLRSIPLPVQLIVQKHSGQAAALNMGLTVCRAPLVSFLDHDDLWTADHSKLLIGMMDADADVVRGAVINRFMQGETKHHDVHMGPTRLLSSTVVRLSSARTVGPFIEDSRSHAIIDWWSRAMREGLRMRTVEQPVLIRRIHGRNEGLSATSRTRSDLLARVRDHRARSATP